MRLRSAAALGLILLVTLAIAAQERANGSVELEARLLQAVDEGALPASIRGGLYDFPDPAVRALAVRVIAVAGNPGSDVLLARFFQDRDAWVRSQVMLAAAREGVDASWLIGRGLSAPSVPVRQAAVWAAAQHAGDLAAPLLAQLRKEKDPAVLETGLANLWRLAAGTWEGLAAQHAADADPLLRRAAAYSLARGGAASARPALRRLVSDSEPVIRATAARGFARGDLQAADAAVLATALRDADWRVRAAACEALAAHPEVRVGPDVAAAMTAALDNAAPHLVVSAIHAVAAHPGAPAAARLTTIVDGADPWAAGEALNALVRRNETGAGARALGWLASSQLWQRRAGARTEPFLSGKAAVEGQRLILAAEPSVILAWLEEAAGADRLPPADVLRPLLGHADAAVRAEALDLLGQQHAAPDRQSLLELAAAWRQDTIGDARATALRLAFEAASDETGRREALEAALAESDWAVSAPVVAAARSAGLRAALPARPPRHGHKWYADLVTWAQDNHWIDVATVRGTFRLHLDAATAPITAKEVWDLARAGFYDGLTIHRVVPDFVVQGGDPRGDGWGGPGFVLADEPSLEPFDSWRAGIATSGPNTGGCQLFVTLLPADHLTGHYTNFALVTAGRDVLTRLEVGDTIRGMTCASGSEPPPPVPVLVGRIGWDDLSAITGWKSEAEAYDPDPAAIGKLREVRGHYRILSVLGSWCSDSRREVPRLIKVLKEVGGDHFTHEMIGVDRTLVVTAADFPDGLLEHKKAERVPTIIVLDGDGQELGRVVETAEMPLEQLLVELVGPSEGW
jgi:cyclophilin family peptidyl-prolyl cis-trans isomerase/HEAT repeat protein